MGSGEVGPGREEERAGSSAPLGSGGGLPPDSGARSRGFSAEGFFSAVFGRSAGMGGGVDAAGSGLPSSDGPVAPAAASFVRRPAALRLPDRGCRTFPDFLDGCFVWSAKPFVFASSGDGLCPVESKSPSITSPNTSPLAPLVDGWDFGRGPFARLAPRSEAGSTPVVVPGDEDFEGGRVDRSGTTTTSSHREQRTCRPDMSSETFSGWPDGQKKRIVIGSSRKSG